MMKTNLVSGVSVGRFQQVEGFTGKFPVPVFSLFVRNTFPVAIRHRQSEIPPTTMYAVFDADYHNAPQPVKLSRLS